MREGSLHNCNYWQYLGGGGGGGGGEVGSVWGGEVELFGREASPAPPSLDETLLRYIYIYIFEDRRMTVEMSI